MKKRGLVYLICVLLVAVISIGAYAYLSDSQTAVINMKAASLKLGEITTIPTNLGDDIKPGDTGSFKVKVKNEGTIPGEYTITIGDVPDYLKFTETTASGVVNNGDTVEHEFFWSIPAETDFGTGGQEINLKIDVDLNQIKP